MLTVSTTLDPSCDRPNAAPPLTVCELAEALAALGGFETRPAIAVAVSGGPDSLALVLLAARWARRRGGQAWGLVVDHGLRTASAAEARTVAGWLAAKGIPHEVLRWAGAKPTTGIQEAAREARYRLLAGWCRAHGVLHLLAAHHREDQAETYLIRRRAGSGVDGLAGMPALRELAGVRLVRPLLGLPKARLAALLAAENQPFLSDPSNFNPVFERVRLRLKPGEASPDDIIAETRRCARRRIARQQELDRVLAGNAALHPAGFAALDPAILAIADDETAGRLLGRLAACVGAAARYPARWERVARLRAALMARPDRGRTLAGCRFVPWRGRILVLREQAATSPPVRLEPGAAVHWDRRFAAALSGDAPRGFMLGALAQSGSAVATGGDLPRLVRPVLPAFWDDAGLAAVPHLGYRRGDLALLPSLAFCPLNPLTTGGFTVV